MKLERGGGKTPHCLVSDSTGEAANSLCAGLQPCLLAPGWNFLDGSCFVWWLVLGLGLRLFRGCHLQHVTCALGISFLITGTGSSLRQVGFNWACGFRSCSLSWLGSLAAWRRMAVGVNSMLTFPQTRK